MQSATRINLAKRISVLFLFSLATDGLSQTTIQLLSQVPQFGVYQTSMPPSYAPPPDIVVLRDDQHVIRDQANWYTLIKLTAAQKQQLGENLIAKVTKDAGCDAFDRIESVVYLTEPIGIQPTANDLSRSVEMARFMTSFSTFNLDASPKPYVFPLMDVSLFAPLLADSTRDIWVGFSGGANPNYPDGRGAYNPCWDKNGNQLSNLPLAPYPTDLTSAQRQTIFAHTGFLFSLDLISTQPAVAPSSKVAVVADLNAPTQTGSGPMLSIAGTLNVSDPGDGATTVRGTVNVIVTSHGTNSEFGFNSDNTLLLNGERVGATFSLQANCNQFATPKINPLNPNINLGTVGANPTQPRNWCPAGSVRTTEDNPGTPNPTPDNPGAPVRAQVFQDVTLKVGINSILLNFGPFTNSFGSYNPDVDAYPTSITFVPIDVSMVNETVSPSIGHSAP